MNKRFLSIQFVWILVALPLFADQPQPPAVTATAAAKPLDELTADATAAIDQLRQQLPAESEAIAMLESILSGRRLGAEDGWFPLAASQTRFGWDNVLKLYDKNADKVLDPSEFPSTAEDFARLDRTQDKKLTDTDFDWTKNSLTRTPGFMMFMMADLNSNGKVTKDEFAALFDRFSRGSDTLALDDLRDQLLPPPPNDNDNAPDRPSRSTLIMGLHRQEVGSLQPGPMLGDIAPDFTLKTLQGETVTLSEQIGEKPIVLIFGNFTCGPFRSQSGNIEKFYQRYKDRAKIFLVYVREAHPSDGWWMESNQKAGVKVLQPTTDDQRVEVATTCRNLLELKVPLLVDHINDQVGSTYSGMPNRLYLIDMQGKIAFKSGRGPFGFHPQQLEQALILLLQEKL